MSDRFRGSTFGSSEGVVVGLAAGGAGEEADDPVIKVGQVRGCGAQWVHLPGLLAAQRRSGQRAGLLVIILASVGAILVLLAHSRRNP